MGGSNLTLTAASGGQTAVYGSISGSGGITVNGAGTTVLSGVNTYSGATLVSQGTLQLSGPIEPCHQRLRLRQRHRPWQQRQLSRNRPRGSARQYALDAGRVELDLPEPRRHRCRQRAAGASRRPIPQGLRQRPMGIIRPARCNITVVLLRSAYRDHQLPGRRHLHDRLRGLLFHGGQRQQYPHFALFRRQRQRWRQHRHVGRVRHAGQQSAWNPYSISFNVATPGSYQICFQGNGASNNYINVFTDVTEPANPGAAASFLPEPP